MNKEQKKLFVAGHQPHYLPWIGYFNKIFQADLFCLVDTVQYEKKYFQNRNKIRTKNGELWLTVPVKTDGRFTQMISEVEIDNSYPWRRKHWKSITVAYGKAPHFYDYAGFFEDVYSRDWKLLVDLDEYIIAGVLKFLNIPRVIVRSSSFGTQGQKTDLLLEICKHMGAGGYLSGTGGSHEYVDEEKLKKARFSHQFQSFTHPIYPQIHGDFVAKMAVIDLLFNCGE